MSTDENGKDEALQPQSEVKVYATEETEDENDRELEDVKLAKVTGVHSAIQDLYVEGEGLQIGLEADAITVQEAIEELAPSESRLMGARLEDRQIETTASENEGSVDIGTQGDSNTDEVSTGKTADESFKSKDELTPTSRSGSPLKAATNKLGIKSSAVASLKKKLAMAGSVNKSFLNKSASTGSSPTPSLTKLQTTSSPLEKGKSIGSTKMSSPANSGKLKLVALSKAGLQASASAMQRQDSDSSQHLNTDGTVRKEDTSVWRKVDLSNVSSNYDMKHIHMAERYEPDILKTEGKWDEMDDDDDWADVIEFADGTRAAVLAETTEQTTANQNSIGEAKKLNNASHEQEHSTLIPTENKPSSPIHEEDRFVDNFDRSYGRNGGQVKGLFNAATGQFDTIKEPPKGRRLSENRLDSHKVLTRSSRVDADEKTSTVRKTGLSPQKHPSSVQKGSIADSIQPREASQDRNTQESKSYNMSLVAETQGSNASPGVLNRDEILAQQEKYLHDRDTLRRKREELLAREQMEESQRRARAKQKADEIASMYSLKNTDSNSKPSTRNPVNGRGSPAVDSVHREKQESGKRPWNPPSKRAGENDTPRVSPRIDRTEKDSEREFSPCANRNRPQIQSRQKAFSYTVGLIEQSNVLPLDETNTASEKDSSGITRVGGLSSQNSAESPASRYVNDKDAATKKSMTDTWRRPINQQPSIGKETIRPRVHIEEPNLPPWVVANDEQYKGQNAEIEPSSALQNTPPTRKTSRFFTNHTVRESPGFSSSPSNIPGLIQPNANSLERPPTLQELDDDLNLASSLLPIIGDEISRREFLGSPYGTSTRWPLDSDLSTNQNGFQSFAAWSLALDRNPSMTNAAIDSTRVAQSPPPRNGALSSSDRIDQVMERIKKITSDLRKDTIEPSRVLFETTDSQPQIVLPKSKPLVKLPKASILPPTDNRTKSTTKTPLHLLPDDPKVSLPRPTTIISNFNRMYDFKTYLRPKYHSDRANNFGKKHVDYACILLPGSTFTKKIPVTFSDDSAKLPSVASFEKVIRESNSFHTRRGGFHHPFKFAPVRVVSTLD